MFVFALRLPLHVSFSFVLSVPREYRSKQKGTQLQINIVIIYIRKLYFLFSLILFCVEEGGGGGEKRVAADSARASCKLA